MQLEWWYWIIAGFILVGLELVVPSFTIVWFGLGALVVGLVKLAWAGIPPWGQFLLWSVSSVCFTMLWFRCFRPQPDRTRAGTSKQAIVGETGTIIRLTGGGTGVVRFRIAVLGADEWQCYADDELHVGDTVRVTDIEGPMLQVVRL